jgi:4-hydroxy-2-oxoheptanedioate aldolase
VFLESKAQRLLERMDRGEAVIGALMMSNSPDYVEIMAYVGFDYVIVDQMFTTVDWDGLGRMVKAARGSELAVIARISNDPWFGGEDPGASARAARAMAVGCDGVKVNVFSARQARGVVEAAAGWHRNPHIIPFTDDSFVSHEEKSAAAVLTIPSVESELGIKETPAMLAIPGLRCFGIAMTDTTRMLGYPLQYEHPEVWKFIDRTVEEARSHNVHICGGTGYAFRTWDAIAERVGRMHEHGINMVFMQTPEFLFQMATTDLLARVRGALDG